MDKNIFNYENIDGKNIKVYFKEIGKHDSNTHKIIIKYENNKNNNLLILAFLIIPLTLIGLEYLMVYFLISILLFIFLYNYIYTVKSENVILIPHIGLEYSVEYNKGYNKDIFIHWEHIQSFIIHEVIQRQRVIYSAAVMIKDKSNETSLLSLFQATKPRLECLEKIFKVLQSTLENYKQEFD